MWGVSLVVYGVNAMSTTRRGFFGSLVGLIPLPFLRQPKPKEPTEEKTIKVYTMVEETAGHCWEIRQTTEPQK